MDPNSRHQLWSKWTIEARGCRRSSSFDQVKTNCARFGRKAFGSVGQMRVTKLSQTTWRIEVRVEGAPIHEDAYVEYMRANWTRFLRNGFGDQAVVTVTSKLEAGERADGKPADQLIIIPPISLEEQLL